MALDAFFWYAYSKPPIAATKGKKLKLSSDVKDSDTITRIAQDENDNALAFEFVKVKGGCDFKGIVEQEVE